MMFSISKYQVTLFPGQLIEAGGAPGRIICDNGAGFTSKAILFEARIGLGFIQPGKATRIAFVESVNAKLRNQCLNLHGWIIEKTRYEIGLWRKHYNNERQKSSVRFLSPVEGQLFELSMLEIIF